jgi:hypothetical protein
MTRRKGERTAIANERAFPHVVEMPMPPGGFGAKLDSIDGFHRDRGLTPYPGRWQRREDQDFVRWCFSDRGDAEAFVAGFGGVLLLPR